MVVRYHKLVSNGFKKLPTIVKGCQELLKNAKESQRVSRATLGYQGSPKVTTEHQGLPKFAKDCTECQGLPRVAKECKDCQGSYWVTKVTRVTNVLQG